MAIPSVLSKLAHLASILLVIGGCSLALRCASAVENETVPTASAGGTERSTWSSPVEQEDRPAAYRSGSQPLTEAMQQGESTWASLDFRVPRLPIVKVASGGSGSRQWRGWLRSFGPGHRVYWPASLQILFCTWQA